MARLAEYMSELSRLLGEPERVHFSKLEPGSAVLVSTIEDQAASKVGERLQKLRAGTAPADVQKAFHALDSLLAKDNAVATLVGDGEVAANVIRFPGRTRPKPMRYGPFREDGSLDGVVIRIGGRDDSIPVLLKDVEGTEYRCQTSVDVSKELAAHYRGATLRVHGSGKWVREESGSWTLQQFDIYSFDVLEDVSLADVVKRLREVKGNEWNEDPRLRDVSQIRGDKGTSH